MKNAAGRRHSFGVGDGVVIGAVLLLSVFLLLGGLLPGEGREVEILAKGERIASLSLNEDTVYSLSLEEYHLTVTVRDGKAFVSEADCPDRVCLHSGAISRAGDIIVCAPAGVVLRVVGEEGSADAVAG